MKVDGTIKTKQIKYLKHFRQDNMLKMHKRLTRNIKFHNGNKVV